MRIFITGTSGFIGFHLANLLLKENFQVFGYDGLTPYYDINLKKKRNEILLKYSKFSFNQGMLEDLKNLEQLFEKYQPEVIVHLAAQAGVRYSLENPRSYLDSNVIGTFNVMEMAKKYKVSHLLMASTSSVYGSNTDMPFVETSKADTQLTIYAATKKATESMAHAYAHLWNLPTTMVRFFTVYGPWGRPDMALYKFVSAILDDKPIDIFNQGKMYRDFTYIDDLVLSIRKLIDVVPSIQKERQVKTRDSLSEAAPFRIVNIGNSKKVKLLDFIEAIENVLQKKAIRNYMPIQKGDVPETWSDTSLLDSLIDYHPETDFKEGITRFIEWYKDYYKI
tara:strand:+ start:179 stop:1186 length:1008 start_codon:yes stop_codon:yes gene_type:complete